MVSVRSWLTLSSPCTMTCRIGPITSPQPKKPYSMHFLVRWLMA
jgi:hypothetical protein